MSSVQSAYAQIGPREKYLAVTGTGVLVTVDSNKSVTSSMNATDFADATSTGTTPAVSTGQLYRDMGKTVVVHDDDSLLAVAKYQKVQLVHGGNNGDTEGVGNYEAADAYLLVWRATGAAVGVARVG
jgi:hypothetical protein